MIIFTHHTGEPHGILGAQVAATFFERKLSIPSIVIGIERDFSKEKLLHFIDEYYEKKWSPTADEPPSSVRGTRGATSPVSVGREKVVGFSHLCGRKDLIALAKELKQEGFITILGGPQVRQDYDGEPEVDSYPHRFRGIKSIVDISFHGFIRPTPWDDSETVMEVDRNIFLHRFFDDILPEHSTPLIIHHASYLGDWIRQIESTTGITFSREGTWIEWWNPSSKTEFKD